MELEETQFYARELIDALKAVGFRDTTVEQTGGGTATIYARKDTEEHLLGGPGWFNWLHPSESVFTTDELFVGETDYAPEGVEDKDWDPHTIQITSGASTADIVKAFEEVYATAQKRL